MAKQIYGIIGHPVEHSLSPAMQNAAFKSLSIDAEYRLFDVAPSGLEEFLKNIIPAGISGLNVTIPHKIKAKEFVENAGVLDENAKKLGAINTIKVEGLRLKGYNTDGPGFYRSLVEDLKFEPEAKNVFVLGAGGAAMAVVMYLGNGPKKICLHDLDRGKTEDLEARYRRYYDGKRLEIVDAKGMRDSLMEANLLINATPVGMKETDPLPVGEDMLHRGLYIYDLVYNLPVTALVKKANALKLHAVTGLGMLLYQGAIAFEIWTGLKAPVDVMRRELKRGVGYRV